uniref:DZIP3-like HEPN domain-containing protein n=2 Tax=Magallana gigas TaxID=29159 RepID=A0A8W8M9X6_MAGGI
MQSLRYRKTSKCKYPFTFSSDREGDLFRDILSHYIQPANLRTELDKNKNKLDKVKSINPQQKRLLYPDPGKASPMAKDLDFSVLYVLIRNICGIKPHKNGWGDNIENSDNSIAACIDRIRLQRNLISGHSKTGSMDNASFHSTWTVLESSIIEIEKQLTGGNMYKRAVNALYLCELSPSSTKRYVEEITRTFKSEISKKKARIDDFESQLNLNTVTKKARLDKVEDQQNSVTQEFRERFEEFETSILSILQGRDSALKEYIKDRINGMEQKLEGQLRANVSALEDNIEDSLSTVEQNLEEKFSKLEKKVKKTLDRIILLPSAIPTLTIGTPASKIKQISYVKSGRLWVKSFNEIIQVDNNGNVKEIVYSSGPFCVSKDDALLYKSDRFYEDANEDEDEDEDEHEEHEDDDKYGDRIKKKTSRKTITLLKLLKTERSEDVIGIYSCPVTGHILVLIQISTVTESPWQRHFSHKITWYDKNGLKIGDIWINDRIQGWRFLLYAYACITENKNGDIIISCNQYETVVGMDRSGEHRFLYSHPENLTPMDICTDKYGHILVAFKSCIHLLDEDGAFQTILLENVSSNILFTCLCLDDKQNIYVGNDRGIVNVYKYLKDE